MNQIFFMCLVTTTTHIMTEETIKKLQFELKNLQRNYDILKNNISVADFNIKLKLKLINDLFDGSIIGDNSPINDPQASKIDIYRVFSLLFARINDKTDPLYTLCYTPITNSKIIINYVNKIKKHPELEKAINTMILYIEKTSIYNQGNSIFCIVRVDDPRCYHFSIIFMSIFPKFAPMNKHQHYFFWIV